MPSTAQQSQTSDASAKHCIRKANRFTAEPKQLTKMVLHLEILFERPLCKTRKRKQIAKSKVIHYYGKQLLRLSITCEL